MTNQAPLHHSYTTDRRKIVDLLVQLGPMTIAQLCAALDRDYDATRKLLVFMARDRLVVSVGVYRRTFAATNNASSSRHLAPRLDQ